jgi:uncharacterized protein
MDHNLFNDVVTSEDELRLLLGMPSELVLRKQLPALDPHSRAFIALSPFVLISTANATGECGVSPRGDAPGAVLVLDDRRLVIPDRPGNRRIDTLRNIVANPQVGLLFLIPGVEETLRVNGRAYLTRDEALLERTAAQGKRPKLAIGVEVRECFLHCAKAFRRSRLWDSTCWPERSALPTLGQMLIDQLQLQVTAEALDCDIEEGYATRLY